MTFYALQIVCRTCGASFLVGGSPGNDLTRWRGLTVECRRCSAETPTTDGEAVDLRGPSPNLATGSPVTRRARIVPRPTQPLAGARRA